MNKTNGITILGAGHFVPGPPITNDALARVMDTNDEWVTQRTGIRQRHFADEGQGVSDLAVEATRRALEDARLSVGDIDYIIFATMTPEYIFPGSGGLLGAKLGITGVPALDIRQQCASIPFALEVANGLASSYRTILVVGADAHAGFMPWVDWDVLYGQADRPIDEKDFDRATRHRGLAVIFGDGAGALVVRAAEREGHGFLGAQNHTDGRYAEDIYVPGGGFRRRPYWTDRMFHEEEYIPRMDGRDLFRKAVQHLPRTINDLCAKCSVKLSDIDFFVAHQANDRINAAVQGALGVPVEKIPSNIANYGNTSAATIPILFSELRRDGRVREGDLLCFFGLGAGLNWGATLMRL